ncbi:hypothetical protein D3C81_1724630 [compost metagenome]
MLSVPVFSEPDVSSDSVSTAALAVSSSGSSIPDVSPAETLTPLPARSVTEAATTVPNRIGIRLSTFRPLRALVVSNFTVQCPVASTVPCKVLPSKVTLTFAPCCTFRLVPLMDRPLVRMPRAPVRVPRASMPNNGSAWVFTVALALAELVLP